MQRDISSGGSEEERATESGRGPTVQTEAARNSKTDRPHRCQQGVLDDDENHRMGDQGKKWRDQQDDRLDMIAKERSAYDGDVESAVDELPKGLDVIG